MTPNKKIRKIYIAADALWDLRQGTLTRINPEFAVGVTGQPEYYVRDQDLFAVNGDTLKPDLYRRIFERYRHEILRCSMRTEILDFLRALCKEYMKQALVTPHLSDFAVEINTYPFLLLPDEEELLVSSMRQALGSTIEVSVIYLSLEELTLEKVRSTYSAMVMYEYHPWLNWHNEALKKKPLLEVGLYVPRIFFADKTKITEELRRDMKKIGRDEFEIFSQVLAPFVGIQFLPISLFCAATPLNLPSLRQLVKVA